MKIAVDTKGGDYAPIEIVEGTILASKKHPEMEFVLFGDEDKIFDILKCSKADLSKFEVVNAPEEVVNDESPTMAIKTKKQSSLVMCFDRLKTDPNICGMISAGSTGAILTGSILKIGRVPGVSRPSLAPAVPTETGGRVLLIDSGANMDCKPINLCHFAVMGSIYMKEMLGVENPRVALLNVGTEDKKGNELTHEVFPLLSKLDINFVGNMEARDILSGKYDVVVADGFAGNVLLKGLEATLTTMFQELKRASSASLISKIGALFMRKPLRAIKKKYNYAAMGGSMFIGAKKLVIKSHGSSKRETIFACCEQLTRLYQCDINSKIESAIKSINFEETESV